MLKCQCILLSLGIILNYSGLFSIKAVCDFQVPNVDLKALNWLFKNPQKVPFELGEFQGHLWQAGD